ncbi:MAG: 2-oxo acid dehydrogenase subunit E2 [Pirellulaceae bacterium]|nr:2-oxo acid dehydrogenase subunit E2 [Pirellulaceae bacterium]
MSIDVKLPDLGDGIESGDVLEIYVTEGEAVTKNQGLIELETDKATVTVPSPLSGTIRKILVAPGQSIAVGAVIVQLEATGAAPTTKPAAPAPTAKPTPTPAPAPAQDQVSPASATPVVSTPLTPPVAVSSSAAATTASSAAAMGTTGRASSKQSTSASTSATAPLTSVATTASTNADTVVAASPAVRRFAREVGIDLSQVHGTGDGSRITRDDVLLAVRKSSALAAQSQTAVPPVLQPDRSPAATVDVPSGASGAQATALPGTPGRDDYGPVRTERLTKIRKTIATQMHKSWSTAPQVTNFDDADVTELEAFRVASKDDYAARGIKLTSLPFLVKAVAAALRSHPMLNASLDLENEQLVYHDYVNLGIAVDSPRGLVVPNIRNAHQMSIPDIARALADMAQRVRSGEFSVSELRGGTFTISNLGAIGGTYSTPIVNVPEVAILLVGRTRRLPVVMDDNLIKPRQMMPLSLSYDHRLVDGGAATRFLNDVIGLLEAPSRLLLALS